MNVGQTIRGTACTESQASVAKLYVETAFGRMSGSFSRLGLIFHLRPFFQIGKVASAIC
jgi:hypothetical protein